MSLIIKLTSLGNNSGPFDIYTDADNYTTPIHVNIDKTTLLSGLITDSIPILAENIKLKNNNVFCKNEVSARIYQPLFYNNYILDSAVTSDCKLIFYGAYTQYGGSTANHITKIDKCGNIDQTFTNNVGTGFGGHGVYMNQGIVLDSNDNIYVGSWFTSFNGVSKNHAVKLTNEGLIDSSFNIGTGFQWFTCLPLLDEAEGAIYYGGAYTSYKGVSQKLLIKLDLFGNKIPEFNVGTGFETTVEAILEAGNGKIWVHGYFKTYNGDTVNHIVLLNKADGSRDTSFSTGTGPNNATNNKPMIAVTDGEKLLIGSNYGITTYNGAPISKNIFRLNRNGTIDTSFLAGTGFDVGGGVEAIYNDNGKFLISGYFTSYNGTPVGHLIRLNNDGTLDTSFNCNIPTGDMYSINKLGDYYYIPYDTGVNTYIIRVDNVGNWNYLINSPSCNAEQSPCDIETYSFNITGEHESCCPTNTNLVYENSIPIYVKKSDMDNWNGNPPIQVMFYEDENCLIPINEFTLPTISLTNVCGQGVVYSVSNIDMPYAYFNNLSFTPVLLEETFNGSLSTTACL